MPWISSRSRWMLVLVLPVALGSVLRLWNLSAQVLVGDERWDVSAAVQLPIGELLTQVLLGESNICPPLAAWIRLLMDVGAQPSEWTLRLPAVICGVAALVLLPLLVHRAVGARAAWLFALLLAIAPLLVFYSRMVRFYSPLILLTTICILAFDRFFGEHAGRGARLSGALFAMSAALSIYVHLLAAPFVLAPLLFGALVLIRRREAARAWVPLVGLSAATMVMIGLLIGPLSDSIWLLLAKKGGAADPGAAAFAGAAMRLTGSTSSGVAIALYAVAARGLFVLFRSRPEFAALTAFVAVAGVGSVVVLAPIGSDGPILLSRYVLPVVPLLLLWAAVGMGHPVASGQTARTAQGVAVLAFAAVLIWNSPLGAPDFYQSSFAHRLVHEDWSAASRPTARLESERFYETVRGPVIEVPYHVVLYSETAAAHQRIHRQPVWVSANLDVWWDDPRLGFERQLRPDPDVFLASGARHLVIHARASEEEFEVQGRDAGYPAKVRRASNFSRNVDFTSAELAERLRKSWGPPVYRDAWIVAWDLDRVRSPRFE